MTVAMKNHVSVKIIRKILQKGYNSTIFSETNGHWPCYHSIIFPHSGCCEKLWCGTLFPYKNCEMDSS